VKNKDFYSFQAETSSRRLDLLLVEYFEELGGIFSRNAIQGWIKSGNVTVNGASAKPSLSIDAGDRIEILIPPPPKIELGPQNIPIRVVYEDEYIIVIDKEAGVVVHPAPGNLNGTLVNAVLYHTSGKLSSIGGNTRPGVVHRLDKDTSGLIVMAKTDAIHMELARQFASKRAGRIYIAVVHGCPNEDLGRWQTYFGRHPGDRKKFTSKLIEGKIAVTNYKVLSSNSGCSVIKVDLETGRTHQIRVHMSEHGFPIVGDETYGHRSEDKKLISRQALHAIELTLLHPVYGIKLSFISNLPDDMVKLIEVLKCDWH
jgi:23S rRNA pseudouridine1911/1915/1917 synthase